MHEFRYTVGLPEVLVRAAIAPWYRVTHRRTDLFLEEDLFLFSGVCASYIWLSEREGKLWVFRDEGALLPRCVDDFVRSEGVVLTGEVVCEGSSAREQFRRSNAEDRFVAWADSSFEAAKKVLDEEMRRYYRRSRK